MAGLCQPRAAATLVKALKEELGLPIHFHTHDTSGIGAASVLAAVEAGADAVDGAIDALSGLTSQPNLGSIVEALRHGPRDSGLDPDNLRVISAYWEQVRRGYVAFESDIRAGASEVYVHGMPGGQYTNLREQARSLGIEEHRWSEVRRAYTQVNAMFGDIVKVTPTSKVVGDMAIMMVTSGLTPEAVRDPEVTWHFRNRWCSCSAASSASRRAAFRADLQKKVLAGRKPLTVRAGELLPPADLEAERAAAEAKIGRAVTDFDLASHLMYPKVFADYAADRASFGEVSILPTSVFFYGMQPGQEINIDLERGKTLIVKIRGDERCARGRNAHRVLRAQRAAEADPRARQEPGGEASAPAQGRSGQCQACRGPHAGDHRHRVGPRRVKAWRAGMRC